jgi:hypothetical protein
LSTGQGGRGLTSEPVAMRMFFVFSVWLPPSLREALTYVQPRQSNYYKEIMKYFHEKKNLVCTNDFALGFDVVHPIFLEKVFDSCACKYKIDFNQSKCT